MGRCEVDSTLEITYDFRVRQKAATTTTIRWAKKLAAEVSAVMSRYPEADPEDVRLTLISLQSPPLARLNRSLRRGRGFAAFRKKVMFHD